MENLYYHQTVACKPPRRGCGKAAGVDLATPSPLRLAPGRPVIMDTGVKVKLPANHYGRLALRSSIAASGLVLTGGVIDQDYTGTLKAVLINCSCDTVDVPKDTYVVQLICEKIASPAAIGVSLLAFEAMTAQSQRGDRGFGSSGL